MLKIKRTHLFAFFCLFFLFLFSPVFKIGAINIGYIAEDTFNVLFNVGIGIISQVFVAISNLFLTLASGVLSWVTSPGFISISFTNVGLQEGNARFNPVVFAGWSITRDLANMGFVIALVVIGLGTALKLKEYELGKALPVLLAMALLVNFSNVFCGIIIDASNILMDFFIGELQGWGIFSTVFKEQWANISEAWQAGFKGLTEPTFWAQSLSLMFFGFFAGAIMACFAILFIVRYAALWILVILSPLAFAANAMPFRQAKSFWNKWFNQLLSWSFVGAIAGFFLYLGQLLLFYTFGPTSPIRLSNPPTDIPGGVFDKILPYFLSIIFLGIGFFTSLSSSAMGASIVANFARGQLTRGGKFLWRRYGRKAALAIPGAAALGARAGIKGAELAAKGTVGRATTSKWFRRTSEGLATSTTPVLGIIGRKIGRAGLAVQENAEKRIKEEEKKLKEESSTRLLSELRSTLDPEKKIAIMNQMVTELKKLETAMNPEKTRNPLRPKEIMSVYSLAKDRGVEKTIKEAMPVLEEQTMREKFNEEDKTAGLPEEQRFPSTPVRSADGTYALPAMTDNQRDRLVDVYSKDYIKGKKSDDVAKMASIVLENDFFIEAVVKDGTSEQFGGLIKTHGERAADKLMEKMDKMARRENMTTATWLREKKPRVYRYITKGTQQDLFGPLNKQIDEEIEREKEEKEKQKEERGKGKSDEKIEKEERLEKLGEIVREVGRRGGRKGGGQGTTGPTQPPAPPLNPPSQPSGGTQTQQGGGGGGGTTGPTERRFQSMKWEPLDE